MRLLVELILAAAAVTGWYLAYYWFVRCRSTLMAIENASDVLTESAARRNELEMRVFEANALLVAAAYAPRHARDIVAQQLIEHLEKNNIDVQVQMLPTVASNKKH